MSNSEPCAAPDPWKRHKPNGKKNVWFKSRGTMRTWKINRPAKGRT